MLIVCREFQQMTAHIASLQQQVDSLFASLNSLRKQVETSSSSFPTEPPPLSVMHTPLPATFSTKSRGKHPLFRGPTSSAFNLDVARSSLKTMGITPTEDAAEEGNITQNGSPVHSPHFAPVNIFASSMHPNKDPLWFLPCEEAIRLCRVYEEEMGMMYPILDIEKLIRQVKAMYVFIEAATRTGLAQPGMPGADALQDDSTHIIKMVLATALIVEGSGQSNLGQRLFNSVRQATEQSLFCPVDIKGLRVLIIVVSTPCRICQSDS